MRLIEKTPAFCAQFIQSDASDDGWGNRNSGVALPTSARVVDQISTSDYEYAGHYGHYQFDINNDGRPDTVVGLHSRTHYRDGDLYLVFAGAVPEISPDEAKPSEDAYSAAADVVMPTRWVQNNVVVESFSAEAPWWDVDDHPRFEPRYLYLTPFVDHGSTYFLAWSQQANAQHWSFVFRPRKDYSLEAVCAFQRVRTRY